MEIDMIQNRDLGDENEEITLIVLQTPPTDEVIYVKDWDRLKKFRSIIPEKNRLEMLWDDVEASMGPV